MPADSPNNIEIQVFLSFASAIKNKTTGILKIQSDSNGMRQFAFSQGSCVDFATNVKEELPGSFLFQQKILSDQQYQNYLQKCSVPKTNQWVLANEEIQLTPEKLVEKRKAHFKKIVLGMTLSKVTGLTFQSLPNLPNDQKIINNFELMTILTSKFSLKEIQDLKPELKDTQTLLSVVNESQKKSLTEDQEGLFTVIQHNQTLGEVLDSSFLEQEKIFQWILMFEVNNMIRIESGLESEKRNFSESLTDEQKKNRLYLKKEIQRLTQGTVYDCLEIDTDSDLQDIEQAFNTRLAKFSSPQFDHLFFHAEENLTKLIVDKIQHAYSILSDAEKKKEYDSFLGEGNTGSFMDQSQTLLEEKVLQDLDLILKTRKFDQAVVFLQDQIEKSPSFAKLYSSLVDLIKSLNLISDEKFNQKIFTLFKDGIAKNPKQYKLFILFGEWCLLLQQKNNALKAFQKALHLRASSMKLRKYILELDKYTGKQIIIEAIMQSLHTLNHFEIMGLELNATQQDVRDAYREASKNFHPDLFFSSGNNALKDMSKRVFKEMVSSYLHLKDEQKRKEYAMTLSSSQKKKDEKQKTMVPKSIQAKKYFDQANQFLQSQNYSSAKLNLQLALSYEPDNYLLQKMLKELQSKPGG